jgi:DNA-binding Lrp family transcriptional regulator
MAGDRVAGYLLVDVGPGDVQAVAARLRELDGIALAHPLLGPTDLLAYVETPDWATFDGLLNGRLRDLITGGLLRRVETRLALLPHENLLRGRAAMPPRGSAWIFVDLDAGEPDAVVAKLREMDTVVSAQAVVGGCDIVAYLECGDWGELREVLDTQIRTLPEVVRTDTRLVLMRRSRRREST